MDPDPILAAHPLELHLLEDPQQFRLQVQRHFTDLVQKHRAVARQFELSQFPRDCAGKGTLFVAEQFGLQQRLDNRRTVHRNVGLIASRIVVNHLGDQLLTGAALSLDQDRRAVLRDDADRFEDLAHLFPGPDDVPHLEVAGRFHQQAIDLLFHFAGFQRLFYGHVQLVDVHRFVDVVESPALHGADRRIHIMMGGNHDHLDVLFVLAQILQNGESVHIGKPDVEDHHIRRCFDKSVEPLGAGRGGHHLIALFGEIQFKRLADGTVVIDHENFRHQFPPRSRSTPRASITGPIGFSVWTGKRILTRVPSPAVLKISTIP